MTEITIVTAFFDIGRAKWQGFERDANKYINYFKFWARIKNKIVVYTDAITAPHIWGIREAYGLKDRTQVVVVDDVETLDSKVLLQLKKVIANKTLLQFRERPENPEAHSAAYDYVTYLKPYFMANAVKQNMAAGMLAWVDFGYNHGGEAFPISEEFCYQWEYDFSDKIHIFATEEIDDMPVFEIVKCMRVYISGGIIVGPDVLWEKVYSLFRCSMLHLTNCGMADADQTLLVMAYREAPELFEVHPVMDWFMVLKEFGGAHLTLRQRKPLYKRYKRTAQNYWRKKEYKEAMKWYFYYAKAKLQKEKNQDE
jgi:protein YibB